MKDRGGHNLKVILRISGFPVENTKSQMSRVLVSVAGAGEMCRVRNTTFSTLSTFHLFQKYRMATHHFAVFFTPKYLEDQVLLVSVCRRVRFGGGVSKQTRCCIWKSCWPQDGHMFAGAGVEIFFWEGITLLLMEPLQASDVQDKYCDNQKPRV